VIGFLHSQSPDTFSHVVSAFREGLAEAGYEEGDDVAIEFRWAEGDAARLPALAAELVGREVTVIFAAGGAIAALAAKNATTEIPIVFNSGGDPVALGLVESLGRPGGNVTGVNIFTAVLEPKRLGLLREALPAVDRVAVLLNDGNPNYAAQRADVVEAARLSGQDVEILDAGNDAEIDAAFASMTQLSADALLVAGDPFFNSRRELIVALAAEAAIPAIYEQREFALAGGLMTYGTNLAEAYREGGRHTGRILGGADPAELPVMQSSAFEFVINMQTADALGLELPPGLLAQATEIIE
jgi:putative ABC transport system substrate-binding protein